VLGVLTYTDLLGELVTFFGNNFQGLAVAALVLGMALKTARSIWAWSRG